MKINFKEWKKVSEEKDHSVFRNKDNHELKVAHKGLHPATRGQLAALPLAKGGEVSDPTQRHLHYGDKIPNQIQKTEVNQAKASLAKMAEGGEVNPEDYDAMQQSAGAAAKELYDSAPVQKALDFQGNIDKQYNTAVAAAKGDPEAQKAVAEHSLGIAMGTVKMPGGAKVQEAKQALEGAAGTATRSAAKDVAGKVDPLSRAMEFEKRNSPQGMRDYKAAQKAKRGYADGGEVESNEDISEPISLNLNDPMSPAEQNEPISINLNNPQIPEQLINPNPGAQFAANQGPQINERAPEPQQMPFAMRLTGDDQTFNAMQSAPEPAAAAPQQPQPAAPVAAPPAQPVSPTDAQEKSMMDSLQQAQHGMAAEGNALQRHGKATADALKLQADANAAAQADYQAHYQALDKERAALMADIKASHIDPSHFIDNQTTGARIATAIGLIMSGIGGGMAHQENLASKFLSQQIENDIQAQRANLGKKENLLSANMRQFGNMKDAADMTRIMRADMISNQLQTEAAKVQGPLAKARLEQEAAKLKLQYAPLQQKIAMNKTINAMTAAAQADPSKAPALINAIAQGDPARAKDLQGRLVPGVGFANTAEDAKGAKDMMTDATGAKQAIKRLKEINTVSGKSLDPSLRAEAFSLSKSLVGQLNRAFTGGGPMSAQEQELIGSIARNPTDFFTLSSSTKKSLDTLEKTLNTKVSSYMESRGLATPDPVKKLTAQQQSFVKFARENPGNPKSAMILKKFRLE